MPEPTAAETHPLQATERIARVALISVPGGVPNLDAPLEAIIAGAPDMATRVRLPLSLYDPQDQAYDPWLKVAWVLECREQRLARVFREELDQFVRAFVERHQ